MKYRLLSCLLPVFFFFGCVFDDSAPTTPDSETGASDTFTDPRDGQVYRIVSINNRVWMAENLRYTTENSQCFSDAGVCYEPYGRYYAWGDAMIACPEGWHLPSISEFITLPSGNAPALKSASGWDDYEEISGVKKSGNGTDDYGFSVKPAGYVTYYEGDWAIALIDDAGYIARFWTSTERLSPDSASYMSLDFRNHNVISGNSAKKNRFTIRCIQGSSTSSAGYVTPSSSSTYTEPNPVSMVMTDPRDGQEYKAVTIGTQTWMAQNLNYETVDSYCYDDDVSKCALNGRLYLWSAATSACPSGWHLPTRAEFETLINAAGGDTQASTALRSTTGWSEVNGRDIYGFSALPAGKRNKGGGMLGPAYSSERSEAYFWSSTESGVNAYYLELRYFFYGIGEVLLLDNDEYEGFSVRCVLN